MSENLIYNDNDDVEYILAEYLHDDKLNLIKNDYYKLYQFNSLKYYLDALEELKRHKLDYNTTTFEIYKSYSIMIVNQEVVNFLNSKLNNIIIQNYDNTILHIDNKYENHSKIYYDLNSNNFYMDSNIWYIFKDKFKSNEMAFSIISMWYIRKFLYKDCKSILRSATSKYFYIKK